MAACAVFHADGLYEGEFAVLVDWMEGTGPWTEAPGRVQRNSLVISGGRNLDGWAVGLVVPAIRSLDRGDQAQAVERVGLE